MKVLTAAIIGLLSATAFANDAQLAWLIEPGTHVGKITRSSDEEDLRTLYGERNVKRIALDAGEGEVVQGTVLFPGSNREVLIEWKADFANPRKISVAHPNSAWRIDSGIAVGSTLDEVEKLNGGPFKMTGFEWDYPGRTVSWESGVFPAQLQLDFEPSANISQPELFQVVGDGYFSSKNRIMKKMELKVNAIHIRWDI